jgi:hypothetical protein
MALFRNSPPASGQVGFNHALGVTSLESASATFASRPPRNAADFLEIAKKFTFLDRKLTSAIMNLRLGTHYWLL